MKTRRRFALPAILLGLAGCASRLQTIDVLAAAAHGEARFATAAIEAATREAAQRYLIAGWADTDQIDGHPIRWVSGRSATLRFWRSVAPTRVRIFALSADRRPLEAELVVNGRPITRLHFAAAGSEATVDLERDPRAAGAAELLELRFLRDVTVLTTGAKQRRVFKPRNAGIAYVTFGAADASAELQRRRERRMVERHGAALRIAAGASLTTYWEPGPAARLEAEVRHPGGAGALAATVSAWCDQRPAARSELLQPGASSTVRLDLSACGERPTAVRLAVGDGDPDAALEWTWARLVGRAEPAAPAPSAPAPFPADTPILLLVLDAAGAKHFGAYGYARSTTPNSDRLAADGIVFEQAYAPTAYTLASVGSILTGLYPDSHGVVHPKAKLPAAAETLAERLRARGYRTASLLGNHHAGAPFGYDQGFELQRIWRISAHARRAPTPDRYDNYAENLVPEIVRFLERHRHEPLFLYVHFREPHSPYWPPAPFDRKFDSGYRGAVSGQRRELVALERGLLAEQGVLNHLVSLYDGNLAYVDAQIGRVIEALRRMGLYRRAWILVTADHGESFLEHGTTRHSSTVYQENIHVPLIMKLPGRARPQRVRAPASLVDLLPTVLGGLGFAIPASAQGIDLRTTWHAPGVLPRRAVLALTVPQHDGAALIGERYKFLTMPLDHRQELYDLWRDPGETVDLSARLPLRAGRMRQQLRELRAACRRARPWAPDQAVIDQETREALRALGYAQG